MASIIQATCFMLIVGLISSWPIPLIFERRLPLAVIHTSIDEGPTSFFDDVNKMMGLMHRRFEHMFGLPQNLIHSEYELIENSKENENQLIPLEKLNEQQNQLNPIETLRETENHSNQAENLEGKENTLNPTENLKQTESQSNPTENSNEKANHSDSMENPKMTENQITEIIDLMDIRKKLDAMEPICTTILNTTSTISPRKSRRKKQPTIKTVTCIRELAINGQKHFSEDVMTTDDKGTLLKQSKTYGMIPADLDQIKQ